MDRGEVMLYTTANRHTSMEVQIENERVWLMQLEMQSENRIGCIFDV